MKYRVANDHSGTPILLDVRDADTIQLLIVIEEQAGLLYAPWLRLAGCDAPESGSPEADAATEWTITALRSARTVRVELHGWSFARRVGEVWFDGVSLSKELIESGHAVRSSS